MRNTLKAFLPLPISNKPILKTIWRKVFLISICVGLLISCHENENIFNANEISSTGDIPFIYKDSKINQFQDLNKYIISEFENISRVSLLRFDKNRMDLNILITSGKFISAQLNWDENNNYSASIFDENLYYIESNLLERIPAVQIYVDDIIVYGSKFSQEQKEWINLENNLTEQDLRNKHNLLVETYVPMLNILFEFIKDENILNYKKKNLNTGFKLNCLTQNYTVGSCTGQMHYSTSFGYSEASCCWSAVDKVNGDCINAFCIGCCRTYCSPYCTFFSNYCICDGYGQACGECDGVIGPGC